jgi:hypothetical protein
VRCLVAIRRECLGKSPKDAHIPNQPVVCVRVDGQVIGGLTPEATIFFIDRVFEPEGLGYSTAVRPRRVVAGPSRHHSLTPPSIGRCFPSRRFLPV